MLATGCQNLGRLNRKLSEVLYEFSCKCLMQLNRNSSQKTGTNLAVIVFFILTYYYMVFKMVLILVLEKKESIFYFQL